MKMITTDYRLGDIIRDFYGLYIANICRERQLPDERDGMRIVQRRIFWTFYEQGKASRNSFMKSAAIIGDSLKLHPHGDASTYGCLAAECNSNAGLLTGKGNWGSVGFERLRPAAMRYTECKFSMSADNYFEFAHLSEMVPGEMDKKEPKFIPVPIPYALLGGFFGLVKSVGVSRIPPYNVNDLVKRLKYLLKKGKKEVIRPDFKNLEMEGDFEALLKTGKGKIKYYPALTIDEEKKTIEITAISPHISNGNARLESLEEKYRKVLSKIVNATSKKTSVIIEYNTKVKEPEYSFEHLCTAVKDAFTIVVPYNFLVYRDEGDYPVIGVDEWLLSNYNRCVAYRKMSLQGDINEEQAKIDLATAILKCRPLITDTLSRNPRMTKAAMDALEAESLKVLDNDSEMLKKVYAISITRLLTVDLDTSVYKKNIQMFREQMQDGNVEEWLFNWMSTWSKKGSANV